MTTTRPQATHTETGSLFKQPAAVWAVAFASMVTFMGIGLVGPILPTISEAFNATEMQTSLLFTSYLTVTAIMMFFTSWLSSRIGTRNTMLIGIVVIVIGAVGCAMSNSMAGIIDFRAVWGLGNAMFLSTALASIIDASGGKSQHAIVLYEAALGLGLAVGPLVGGLLGEVSWSAPFWGTACLLAIGFVAIITIVRGSGKAPEKSHVSEPFKALRHPAILVLSIASFFYNASFFVVLAYAPYPLGMSALGIGLVMTGFGIGLALTSVVIAPRLAHKFSVLWALVGFLVAFALTLLVASIVVDQQVALIVCTVLLGFEIGGVNTLLTEAVMEATDLPRPVASSAYSGVRFFGGAIGAPIGTALVSHGAGMPWVFAAGTSLVAVLLLAVFGKVIKGADHTVHEDIEFEAESMSRI